MMAEQSVMAFKYVVLITSLLMMEKKTKQNIKQKGDFGRTKIQGWKGTNELKKGPNQLMY